MVWYFVTDVLKEPSAFIFRAKEYCPVLEMEAVGPSEASIRSVNHTVQSQVSVFLMVPLV